MPLKDAIKKAVKENDTFLDFNQITQQVSIYGICANHWPAGKIVIHGKAEGYFIPDMFTIESGIKDKVPEFIKNLYRALMADCGELDCLECPLHSDRCMCLEIIDKIEAKYDA